MRRCSTLLRKRCSADVPVIGHCLGGQLLREGARRERCGARRPPEIGWSDVPGDRRSVAIRWFGRPRRLHDVSVALRRYSSCRACARALLTNAFNPEQALRARQARRLSVPHRDDARDGRDLVPSGATSCRSNRAARSQSTRRHLRDVDASTRGAVARRRRRLCTRWARGLGALMHRDPVCFLIS